MRHDQALAGKGWAYDEVKSWRCFLFLCWAVASTAGIMAFAGSVAASTPADTDKRPLRVGVTAAPPFSIKNADGSWSGLAIELWKAIAQELDLTYRLEEYPQAQLLAALHAGSIDVAAAALPITAAQDQVVDFTHAYYTMGLSIATHPRVGGGWERVLTRLFGAQILRILAVLIGVLFVVGGLVSYFERRQNAAQFGGDVPSGLAHGFWWAVVTMTTVGYGDRAPITVAGRVVAIIWMLASVVIISGFAGVIASSLTVGELQSHVRGLRDLPHVRVGAVQEGVAADYLQTHRIAYRGYASAASRDACDWGGADRRIRRQSACLAILGIRPFSGGLSGVAQAF